MNAWSNIEVSSEDPEIIRINELEASLGKLPERVHKIRELITRHEVCHFKYQQHLQKIRASIRTLEPATIPGTIGRNHIQHGEYAWKNDTTGKSLQGQQYVWAIQDLLSEMVAKEIPVEYDQKLGQKVREWLGKINEDKRRLVRLLLARLTWDWGPYKELQHGEAFKQLEFQICRMDICHYAFPANLDRMLQGIGKMMPVENFEGCGSFSRDIREFVEQELIVLYGQFRSLYDAPEPGENELIQAWLTACLIKTLKEQVELSEPLIEFNR
jgi:hypothetical protein